jgi:hypothetical protein
LGHLNTSAAAIADGNLLTLHDDRHLALPVRVIEHLFELAGFFFDIIIGVVR